MNTEYIEYIIERACKALQSEFKKSLAKTLGSCRGC